ncbi:MAG: neutral/alkaline non-lysosomal ceramidase N-terminal domain-containing protein [Cyclobacteriaceae bacterium]|nr:neutral/alkaline non-lysosomal ceramidase N-terminal domain-containing protein [Cyclobacteriaceae bacterium]
MKVLNIKSIAGIFLLVCLLGNSFGQIKNREMIPVGVASVDITPESPMRLSGYGSRKTVFDSVEQKLWAKAMAIGTDEEGPSVIITLDLVGFPAVFAERLAYRVGHTSRVERKNLAITATHTHSGPETGALLNIFGRHLSGQELNQVVEYMMGLEDKVLGLVKEALANRQPSYINYSKGTASFAMNRRVIEDGKWTGFGQTPDGPVEHDLPLLHITDQKGRTRALLLNYACHGTTLMGDHNFVHGDWMGTAQEMIEKEFPGATAMVVIGCGADSNPQPRNEFKYVEQHGKAITDEVVRVIKKEKARPVTQAPTTTFKYFPLYYDHVPSKKEYMAKAEQDNAEGLFARNSLETLSRGGVIPDSYQYPLQVFSFGKELTMVFMGGEVVVDYVHRLKKELNNDDLWVNAYANDITCYIASERLFDEGGYEVDGSMHYYNKPSRFAKNTEDRIVAEIIRLINKLP